MVVLLDLGGVILDYVLDNILLCHKTSLFPKTMKMNWWAMLLHYSWLWTKTHTVTYSKHISQTLSCGWKYSFEHQMWINLLLKIVQNKCIISSLLSNARLNWSVQLFWETTEPSLKIKHFLKLFACIFFRCSVLSIQGYCTLKPVWELETGWRTEK